MAYGAEARSAMTAYSMKLQHTTTLITANVTMMFDVNPASTEAQRDALFQAFLTSVAAIPNVSVLAATKNGGYSQPVTP